MNALAELLQKHSPDVTSYDAADIHGCRCGEWTVYLLPYDDQWPMFYQHVADEIVKFQAEDINNLPGPGKKFISMRLYPTGAWFEHPIYNENHAVATAGRLSEEFVMVVDE